MIPKISIGGGELRMLLKESFWKLLAILVVLTGPLWLLALAKLIEAIH